MLSARQIDLVQATFTYVIPITDEVAAIFYGKLFTLAPDTRPLFRNDMAEQGRKLFLTLAAWSTRSIGSIPLCRSRRSWRSVTSPTALTTAASPIGRVGANAVAVKMLAREIAKRA